MTASPSKSSSQRICIRYTGRVQGVGFRATATGLAQRQGLLGFVRNESDGSVTLVAEGPRPELNTLRRGVRSSHLGQGIRDEVTQWEPATGEFDGFTVRLR